MVDVAGNTPIHVNGVPIADCSAITRPSWKTTDHDHLSERPQYAVGEHSATAPGHLVLLAREVLLYFEAAGSPPEEW